MVLIPEIIYQKSGQDWSHLRNFDQYDKIRTSWFVCYVKSNKVAYFDCFSSEHIPKKIFENI